MPSDLLLLVRGDPERIGELGCAFSISSVDSAPFLFVLEAKGEYCSTNSIILFSSTTRECLRVMNSRVLRGSTSCSACSMLYSEPLSLGRSKRGKKRSGQSNVEDFLEKPEDCMQSCPCTLNLSLIVLSNSLFWQTRKVAAGS